MAAFLGAAAVIVAIPGPSLLFTIGRALTVGRRDALLTVAGNAVGLFLQSAAVAVGLGGIVAQAASSPAMSSNPVTNRRGVVVVSLCPKNALAITLIARLR